MYEGGFTKISVNWMLNSGVLMRKKYNKIISVIGKVQSVVFYTYVHYFMYILLYFIS